MGSEDAKHRDKVEAAHSILVCAAGYTSVNKHWDMGRVLFCMTEVFNMEKLSNAGMHFAVGDGQSLPCASIALLASLVSIELFPPEQVMPSLAHNVEVNVPADGRCFWSCMYLHHCDQEQIKTWSAVPRNASGFALCVERQKTEELFVQNFTRLFKMTWDLQSLICCLYQAKY